MKTNDSLRFYPPPQMRHTYGCPLHMINCSSLLMFFCPVLIVLMPSYVLLRYKRKQSYKVTIILNTPKRMRIL